MHVNANNMTVNSFKISEAGKVLKIYYDIEPSGE